MTIFENDFIKISMTGRDCYTYVVKNKTNNQTHVVANDDEIGYYPTGCSMTQWNNDCEEIKAEVDRILNEYNLYDHDRNTNVANSNQLVTVLEILKKIK